MLVLPVLAVSVSIGAVMPSAPFDAWSPPPVSVERGARPVRSPEVPSGERGLVRVPAQSAASTLRQVVRALARAVVPLPARPAPVLVPNPAAGRRLLPPPGWALTWWAGTSSGPNRAPPHLPTA